jgi:7-cyano-7-deazaguanine synthase
MKKSAMVLFSGGQDSATCLAWALRNYDKVETIGFTYNQRHKVELDCRKVVLDKIRKIHPHWGTCLSDDHLIDLSLLSGLGETALTADIQIKLQENGLPNTFVPGRNLFFFVSAATIAYRRGISILVGGMCETDFSGYPDCRDNTIKAIQLAINLGLDSKINIETPLMWLTKSETWGLAKEIGGGDLIKLIVDETHTCYKGDRSEKHEWGFGCGDCPACDLRKNGYMEFVKKDK